MAGGKGPTLVQTSRYVAGDNSEENVEDEGKGDERAAIGWGEETETGEH